MMMAMSAGSAAAAVTIELLAMREFFGCYLLHSKAPHTRDRTYIG